MLRAFYASIAKLPCYGDHVVIDELILAPELLKDWILALRDRDVLFVGVGCPLSVLEERENARNSVIGLARGHLRTVHNHGRYDLEVDTSRKSPKELARIILEKRNSPETPTAFRDLRKSLLGTT